MLCMFFSHFYYRQSFVGGEGSQKFKIGKGSPLWRHTTIISQVIGGGGFIWKYSFCNVKCNSSYYRVKLHFIGLGGYGINMCDGLDKKGLSLVQITRFIKDQEDADQLTAKGKQSGYSSRKKKTMIWPSEIVATSKHPSCLCPLRKMKKESSPTRDVYWRGHLKWRQETLLKQCSSIQLGEITILAGYDVNSK